MKKIINGKKYDTETAKIIYEYDNGNTCVDLNYYRAVLHQKKTGEFFLYEHGGANTHLAESRGTNRWTSGSRITPYTELQAKSWCEKHMDADEYEAVFGEVDE